MVAHFWFAGTALQKTSYYLPVFDPQLLKQQKEAIKTCILVSTETVVWQQLQLEQKLEKVIGHL